MDTVTIIVLISLSTIALVFSIVTLRRAHRLVSDANLKLQEAKAERLRIEDALTLTRQTLQETQDEKRETEENRRLAQKDRDENTKILEQMQAERCQADKVRREAAQALEHAKEEFTRAEGLQRAAEQARQLAEAESLRAEKVRIEAEQEQQHSQSENLKTEKANAEAEQKMREARQEHSETEKLYLETQQARRQAETERMSAEKAQAEAERMLSEAKQKSIQAKKSLQDAEHAKQQAEEMQRKAEELLADAKRTRDWTDQLLSARSVSLVTEPAQGITIENGLNIQQAEEDDQHRKVHGLSPQAADQSIIDEEIQTTLANRPPERLEPEQRVMLQGQHHVRGPQPEIVCWQKERQWIFAVELPEEILETANFRIYQNDQVLEKDDSKDYCWRLQEAFGKIIVCSGDQDVYEVHLGQQGTDHLIFKLIGEDQKQGRRVREPSFGAYLVVVPATWIPDKAGYTEDTSLGNYNAFYYVWDKDAENKIRFRTPSDKLIVIESKSPRFELVGNRIGDANEYFGPLFGGALPKIHALDDEVWNGITTIVVGEEGRAKGEWRTSFKPTIEGKDVHLPEGEFANRQGGWYLLRFYNNEYSKVESLDFRFVAGLQSITVNPHTPLPSEAGHSTGVIEFSHNDMCRIQPLTDLERELSFETWEQGTRVLIPAEPGRDKTKWLVMPENGEERQQVQITVQIERIWWAIGEEDQLPTKWTDKPAALSRNDFRATSEKILWLLLPRPRWADQVRIGFAQTGLHQCQTRVDESVLAKPLRDFEGAPVLRQAGTYVLEAKVVSQGLEYDQPLCNVIIQIYCKQCGYPTHDRHSLFEHVTTSHLCDFFTPPTYQDIRARDSKLPYAIFKCYYCDKYIPIDDPRNKTDLMYSHSKICEEAPKLGGIGPREKHFIHVTDDDEIQQVIGINLSKMRKCKLCDGYLLSKHSPEEEMKHLLEKHQNAVFEIR